VKAVILAAGKGTRMRELTSDLPKPMLKVQGRPILEHIIAGIKGAGVAEFCIVTGYCAEAIVSYFGDGQRWGVRISYAHQAIQDGTGRAPQYAEAIVGSDPFLLTYGDILVKPETYGSMLARFSEGSFAGLVTVTPGQDVTKGGINFFDNAFCLRRVVEKPNPDQIVQLRNDGWLKPGDPVWYNAGIYVFQPILFQFTARLKKSPRDEYELTDAINDMVGSGHRIAGLQIQGRWVDVRDPEVLRQLDAGAL
jgi:dTDP-glucose pyrophosphorylase